LIHVHVWANRYWIFNHELGDFRLGHLTAPER
jgi:hypothetical protein